MSQTKSVLNIIRWFLNFAKRVPQILSVRHLFFLTIGLAFVLSSYFGLGQFSVTFGLSFCRVEFVGHVITLFIHISCQE